MIKTNNNCLVLMNHNIDEVNIAYDRFIKKKVEGIMDFILLYDCSKVRLNENDYDFNIFQFDSSKLENCFFEGHYTLINPLVPLLKLVKNSDYEHYLMMENDIVYTGNIREFVEDVVKDNSDYIHIKYESDKPEDHWPIEYIKDCPYEDIKFSWSQMFYASQKLLIDAMFFMKNNNSVFFEFLLPTIAYNNNYKVNTFENLGCNEYNFEVRAFGIEEYEERYMLEHKNNTFYHPIKTLYLIDQLQEYREEIIKNMNKSVILVATNAIDYFAISKYRRIRKCINPSKYDLIMLIVDMDGFEDTNPIPEDIVYYRTSLNELNNMGYEPNYNQNHIFHYSILKFYLENRKYAHYWYVNYKTEFTGNWGIFEDCDTNIGKYDFISCYVEKYFKDEKFNIGNFDWPWWENENNIGIELKKSIKSFNPICRLSCDALAFIDKFQRDGHSGHSEVILPTALYNNGFKIADFGGITDFVPKGYRYRYYFYQYRDKSEQEVDFQATVGVIPRYVYDDIMINGIRNKIYYPVFLE